LWFYGAFSPLEAHRLADAYLLFTARSAAMGWLEDAMRPDGLGQWGMNDAGLGTDHPGAANLATWFQVADVGVRATPPVQSLVACASAVTARLGTFALDAVELLISPVGSVDDHAVSQLATSAGWFEGVSRDRQVRVRASVDTGQVPLVPSMATDLTNVARTLPDIPFSLSGCSIESTTHPSPPGVPDDAWQGPPCHRAVLHGGLVEWTTESIGWLLAMLVHGTAVAGIGPSALITIERS
jgi:hypothetical protein